MIFILVKKDLLKAPPAVLSKRGAEKTKDARLTKVELKRLQSGSNSSGAGALRKTKPAMGGIMLKVHAKKLNAVEILSLEGQIVAGETEILRSAVQLAPDTSEMILDLANVSLVDAHGLGVLLQLREQTLANDIHLELLNVNEQLARVFEITRLNTVFEIHAGVNFIPETSYTPRVLVAA